MFLSSFSCSAFSYLLYDNSFHLHFRLRKDFHSICIAFARLVFTSLIWPVLYNYLKKKVFWLKGNKLMIERSKSLSYTTSQWNAERASGQTAYQIWLLQVKVHWLVSKEHHFSPCFQFPLLLQFGVKKWLKAGSFLSI